MVRVNATILLIDTGRASGKRITISCLAIHYLIVKGYAVLISAAGGRGLVNKVLPEENCPNDKNEAL